MRFERHYDKHIINLFDLDVYKTFENNEPKDRGIIVTYVLGNNCDSEIYSAISGSNMYETDLAVGVFRIIGLLISLGYLVEYRQLQEYLDDSQDWIDQLDFIKDGVYEI